MLKILGGSSTKHIAFEVSKELGIKYVPLVHKRFPDGDKYIRIMDDGIKNSIYIVIQSLYRTPDDFLLEYFLIVDTLKRKGAKKVISFFPYFAYARQDMEFKPGEPISFKTIGKLIESIGTDQVFTFDVHLHRIKSLSEVFNIPAKNFTLLPDIAVYIKNTLKLNEAIIIGPDEESEQWASVASEKTGFRYDILKKERHGDYDIEIKPRELSIKNKSIISTFLLLLLFMFLVG